MVQFLKIVRFISVYHNLIFLVLSLGASTVEYNHTTSHIPHGENDMGEVLIGQKVIPLEQLEHAFGHYTNISGSNRNIIFPDAFISMMKKNLAKKIVPHCETKDDHFCEDIEGYPHHYLNHILAKTNKYDKFFGADQEPIEIGNRLFDPEEKFFCASFVKTIYPKAGKNKDEKWKYIINQGDIDPGHSQSLRIETCLRPDAPCNLLAETPFGYVTSCKQKLVYRRLLTIGSNGEPAPDAFIVPAACCCSYKRDVGTPKKQEKRI